MQNGYIYRCLAPAVLVLAACGLERTDPVGKFQECPECPVMVEIPAGSFLMGTAEEDRLTDPRTGEPATNDGPQHEVTIKPPFAIGQYEVTVDQYAAFVQATGHRSRGGCMEFSPPGKFTISKKTDWDKPGFEQSGDHPVGCVSFFDAQAYADWLSERTGSNYRLPTEAEWEYAARAGSTGPYFWGDSEAAACDYANIRTAGAHTISKRQIEADKMGFPCDDGAPLSSPAGRYRPNAFGLYDVQGNNWEWVLDCNHKDYNGAPTDGSAWLDDEPCRFGVIRGGSYLNLVERSSATVRAGRPQTGRATNMGFRVARGAPTGNTQRAGQLTDSGATRSQLFEDNCAACHTHPGNFEGLYGKDQRSVEEAISTGGNNIMSMPAFEGILSNDEISELAAYIRRVNGWD